MNNQRILLIYHAVVSAGDRNATLKAVNNHADIHYEDLRKVLRSIKSKVLTYLDPDYPSYLKLLPEAPLVLFYYGDISLIDDYHYRYNLGLVGTRSATEYGIYHTKKIVAEVSSDCVIVSGLAKGIDGTAHQAALDNNMKTIAVLGSGIDVPYPKENEQLYHDIIDRGGLVISEYPNLTPASNYHFPTRNRLIAMFSRALLVTEATGLGSGTGITVGFTWSYHKKVMALVYPAEQIDSYCNELIFEGAELVRDGKDVLKHMDLEIIKII